MTEFGDEFEDLRIVLVDDNRNFQNLLRTMLRHFGFRRIDPFADPAAALDHVHRYPAELVFVDHVMPAMTGVEWTRRARRDVGLANPDMAVVMVTGHADEALLTKAIAAGVDDVLTKPLAPETLLRHVRWVLTRPRPYRRAEGGYYGPETTTALARLREMGRTHRAVSRPTAASEAPSALPEPIAARRPRFSVPGLDVEIRRTVDTSADTLYLD